MLTACFPVFSSLPLKKQIFFSNSSSLELTHNISRYPRKHAGHARRKKGSGSIYEESEIHIKTVPFETLLTTHRPKTDLIIVNYQNARQSFNLLGLSAQTCIDR